MRRLAAVVACILLLPAAASAQLYIGRDLPRAGAVEVSGGGVWGGGSEIGSASAEETRNTGTGTGPFVLFTVDSRVRQSIGAQGRVGVYVSRGVSVEAGVQFARPVVASRLSDDAESAAETTATETLTRLVVDGSLALHQTQFSFAGGKGVPFILGGGGYVRDLHEKNEVIETGHEYHAGAGFKMWFGQGKHRVGLRTDVGLSMRRGGAEGRDTGRTVPTAGVSVAYLF